MKYPWRHRTGKKHKNTTTGEAGPSFVNGLTVLMLVPALSLFPAVRNGSARAEPTAPVESAPRTRTPWVYPIMTAGETKTTQYAPIFRGFEAPAQRWLPGHRGVDFLVDDRTKIVAPVAGTVTFSGKIFNRNSITITDDDGFKNSFEPVRSTLRRNDAVQAGDVIGSFAPEDKGHSHCLPKECVHWGVRSKDGDYRNPLFFLHGTERSILLPYLE